MRLLSLSPLTVLPCSPLELIDAASEAGFDNVSLRLLPVLPTDIEVMADRSLQRDMLRRLADSPVGVFDVEVVRVTPSLDVSAHRPMLEFAKALGARYLAVTSGTREAFGPDVKAVVLERLVELSDVAAEYDLGVMLEFIPYRGISSLNHALDVVRSVGRPNLAVTVDALHFFRSGGTIQDLRASPASLLACAQLCDAPLSAPDDLPREARYGRLFPGVGTLPLGRFVDSLPPNLPVCVEVPAIDRDGLSVRDRARAAFDSLIPLLSSSGDHSG